MLEILIINNGFGYYVGERFKIAEPIAKDLIKRNVAIEIKATQTTETAEPIKTTIKRKRAVKTNLK